MGASQRRLFLVMGAYAFVHGRSSILCNRDLHSHVGSTDTSKVGSVNVREEDKTTLLLHFPATSGPVPLSRQGSVPCSRTPARQV